MSISSLFRTKPITQIRQDIQFEASLTGDQAHGTLRRSLGVWDLTSFGIAAIIGAGIFSTIGNASFNGGPGVVLLFVFTAIVCAFSALCYAEFASRIPAAGSAYTYAYASLGEFIAWIIGWDLIMEYAIGNIAVAISWSDYFTGLLAGYGIEFPKFITMDFLTASRGFDQVSALLTEGKALTEIEALVSGSVYQGYLAWTSAPQMFAGIPFICDIPALLITVLVTSLVYVGIQESKRASNFIVALKLGVIFLVIALGSFYVQPSNWSPFLPNGMDGVMKGVSAVFFAFIGFDAISTTAEECRNPQRDLPLSMIYSLAICTGLYIAITLILTGMVNYSQLQVGDPLAFVFGPAGANIPWVSGMIAVSAVIAMTGVLLVFQIGQPRIWMAMSRDGLLPSVFSSIHPKFKTPWFSTILTGLLVAVPSLFMNLTEVTDLSSIGTLFAFAIVCGGVLKLHMTPEDATVTRGTFRVPYINGKYFAPGIFLIALAGALIINSDGVTGFFSLTDWETFRHKIPFLVYVTAMAVLAFLSFRKNLSLLPALGVASCGYLISEMGVLNWIRFGLWLLVGLVIYFGYSQRRSKLQNTN